MYGVGRTAKVDDGAHWLVVHDSAARATAEVAIRSALSVQRDRLVALYVDIASDDEWPAEVRPAVQLAERRLSANPRHDISLALDPRVDEDFEIALTLAPLSISCTGTSLDGALTWDANDTGTSAAFSLTPAEELLVRLDIIRAGGSPDDLIRLA